MNDSIHQVLAELIGNGALDFKAAGLGIWSGSGLCHGPLDGYQNGR